MLICDTSGLLALADGDDPAHESVAAGFRAAEPPYIVSPLVLAEVDRLLRVRTNGHNARSALRSFTAGQFEVPMLTRDELRTAIELDERYDSLRLGMTDCTLVVLARRFDTRDVLTLDERCFRAIKPLQGGSFRLLPTDLRG